MSTGRCGNRGARGEGNATATLTEAQVRALLRRHARGERQQALARLFGISKGQVSKIVHGQAWAHLHGPVHDQPGCICPCHAVVQPGLIPCPRCDP